MVLLFCPAVLGIIKVKCNRLWEYDAKQNHLRRALARRPVTIGLGSDLVDIPRAQIAAAVAWYGVTCETAQTVSGNISVGDALLNFTADNGIDLIVMGCYGHSRLREFVFGGATRTILAHMTAPVLMSH